MNKNSFSYSDYMYARSVISETEDRNEKRIEELIIRRRKAQLRELVRKVIKNELSQLDRRIVVLHWYKGLGVDETAQKVGISRSYCYKRLEAINATVYDKLKYVMEYRLNDEFFSADSNDIRNELTMLKYSGELDCIGDRLRALRENSFLTVESVCASTGIPEKRLVFIEKNGKDMTVSELKKLSSFYRVESDSILFSKKPDRLQQPLS